MSEMDPQRTAAEMIRDATADVRAPDSLRANVEAMVAQRSRRRRIGPRLPALEGRPIAIAAAVAIAALAIVLSLAFGGGGATPAGPTVAQAATLTQRPATLSAPRQRVRHSPLLDRTQSGLPFPYWQDRFGWRTAGARVDQLAGRQVTTVFYRRADVRIGYAIVAGAPLGAMSGAATVHRAGVRMWVLRRGGRTIVTWPRRGHTCVLSAPARVAPGALEALASWRARGSIPY